MTKKKADVSILFFDIETTPLLGWLWRCGEQHVRHSQLKAPYDKYRIITIGYCWNDGLPAKTINWGWHKQDTASVIEKFDKIIKQADIAIGKNSDRFDVKHINTQRFLAGLPALPEWATRTDDVEKQLRKHFIFPSYGLDYVSSQLGLGGKRKMEMQDWTDIVEKKDKKKLAKMDDYCAKDVEDTRALWNMIKAHVTPKFNMATFLDDQVCKNCGSSSIVKDGTTYSGRTRYQKFRCNSHGGYAGRATFKKDGSYGRIG